MKLVRLLRHLTMPQWRAGQVLPRRALLRIEHAIGEAESRHFGQIRFAVENALDLHALLRGESARERAIEVFAALRVWDTEHNNGVLIYLLLADHDVEIVADRGIHERVGGRVWEEVCRDMEAAFREGRFEAGVLAGIARVSGCLETQFPRQAPGPNELPDRPVVL
ncbi:MAG TPA: TPM domain-containing protein [Burkholderiales bacterium]|nr:TPM domain-containing protein [Burkholderiales bacterium]